jgi:hypothetical protein
MAPDRLLILIDHGSREKLVGFAGELAKLAQCVCPVGRFCKDLSLQGKNLVGPKDKPFKMTLIDTAGFEFGQCIGDVPRLRSLGKHGSADRIFIDSGWLRFEGHAS